MEMEKMNKCIHWICVLVFLFLSIVSFAMPAHFEIVAENMYGEEALIIDVEGNDIKIIKDLAYSEQGQQLVAGTLKVETEWPFSVVGDYVTPPSIDQNVWFPGYYDYTNLYCRVGTNRLAQVDLVSDARISFHTRKHPEPSHTDEQCDWEIHVRSSTPREGPTGHVLLVFTPYPGEGTGNLPARTPFCTLTDTNGVCRLKKKIEWYWIYGVSTNSLEFGNELVANHPEFPVRVELSEPIDRSSMIYVKSALFEIDTMPSEIQQFTNQLFQAWEKRNDLH